MGKSVPDFHYVTFGCSFPALPSIPTNPTTVCTPQSYKRNQPWPSPLGHLLQDTLWVSSPGNSPELSA
ncbi:Uncharacterized protein HZ326_19703 [Fusarium oxysporum f. sp. albedinis]|nr:Uncharacterized protein HZ326_19703 [Fusarium oxysporum f. sp. albedinis]